MKAQQKVEVGILGATGLVGQQLVALLNQHPYFILKELVASERSAGHLYLELVPASSTFNPLASQIKVKSLDYSLSSELWFSCLEANLASEWEQKLAEKYWVISNASSHRMFPNIPLIIPEINGEQLGYYFQRYSSRIITNPNCVVAIIAMALAPIIRNFGLKSVQLTTMQSLSGAGYPGVAALDIMGNILPYILDEEEKIEPELRKIFGEVKETSFSAADFSVIARCFRVPVSVGHLISLFFTTRSLVKRDQLIEVFQQFKTEQGEALIDYREDLYFPQPTKHLPKMQVAVGHLRGERDGWLMTVLGNNLLRGAAGAALANAELWYRLKGLA